MFFEQQAPAMISEALLLIAFGYLGLLFIIAAWADRRAKAGLSVIGSPRVYWRDSLRSWRPAAKTSSSPVGAASRREAFPGAVRAAHRHPTPSWPPQPVAAITTGRMEPR
jgi:hypothetical protein